MLLRHPGVVQEADVGTAIRVRVRPGGSGARDAPVYAWQSLLLCPQRSRPNARRVGLARALHVLHLLLDRGADLLELRELRLEHRHLRLHEAIDQAKGLAIAHLGRAVGFRSARRRVGMRADRSRPA